MNRKVFSTQEDFKQCNAQRSETLPYDEDLTVLATPVQICGRTVYNRLVCQAMEGCDGELSGEPGELTKRRYLRFARGGAGMIWFEATACRQDGRANPRQLWLREDNVEAFRRLLDEIRSEAVKANGYAPLIIMQDTHSGRYSKPKGKSAPIVARNNPLFEKDSPLPADCIATDAFLDQVKEGLIRGAKLAVEAGFDGVDIKCCHGYLNSELLSAFTRENSRYGGSYENRTRLLRETVAGAVAACPKDFIISSRLNAYDGFPYPYGWGVKQDGSREMDLSEPIMLLRDLAACGVRLVNITMGNPYVNPHVNRPFAKGGYEPEEHPLEGVARILNGIAQLQAAVPEVALISSAMTYLGVAAPQVAAGYINRGGFSFAGFGRLTFANPDFANQILHEGKLDEKKNCICCSKCTELMRNGSTPGCVIRDKLYTDLYREVFSNK